MSIDISYSSIAEIHHALIRKENSPRELYDYIEKNYSEWKAHQAEDRIQGSEGDFHNLTVEFSRQNCVPFAAAVATIGVGFYPMSTDLLADMIKYSQEIGDSKRCRDGLERLKKIDRKYWKWRTFAFAIDYLKDSLSSLPDLDEFKHNLEEAKELIEEFKKYIPYEERSYVAEAELYQNQNDFETAMASLQEGIEKVAVAPQCCMKLADLYLDMGEYEKVGEYAKKGLLATTQEQPTVSIGYLYYLLALSMDAGRIKRRQAGGAVNDSEIQTILTAYRTADKLLVNEGRSTVSYRNTIRAKLIIIEMEEGISAQTDAAAPERERDI